MRDFIVPEGAELSQYESQNLAIDDEDEEEGSARDDAARYGIYFYQIRK